MITNFKKNVKIVKFNKSGEEKQNDTGNYPKF